MRRRDAVAGEPKRVGATPYDIKDVELGHHGKERSFDAFVHKYALDEDLAMASMAKVIRGADTMPSMRTARLGSAPPRARLPV